MTARVEKPKELAARVGLSVDWIHTLIKEGRLDYVPIGKRRYIPEGAWDKFLEEESKKEKTSCLEEIKEPACDGANGAKSGTSTTADPAVAEASVRRALTTAKKLRKRSPNSSVDSSGEMGRVIPLKS